MWKIYQVYNEVINIIDTKIYSIDYLNTKIRIDRKIKQRIVTAKQI